MSAAAIDALDHAIRSWGAHQNWPVEEVLRLFVAAVAGGLVGLEREVRGRQAGFRTNLLVAVGSALVMIVSISFPTRAWPHDQGFNVNVDPARVAYGIMMGIGFLGAGTIVKHGSNVHGLTTAAGLWCVAAVGMAAGFGLYTLTAVSTALIVLALWLLNYTERVLPRLRYRMVTVRRPWRPGCVEETIERLREAGGVSVSESSFQRTGDLAAVDITARVAFFSKHELSAFRRAVENDPQYQVIAMREE
jgi:putative Mg2+ transporter-C (MgtC) family protein